MKLSLPPAKEYPADGRVDAYISLLPPEADLLKVLENQRNVLWAMLHPLLAEPERADYRYAPGKWSVKEVLGHLTDTERVFAGRILAIARGETQPLPGFDENAYMAAEPFAHLSLFEVLHYYESTRAANMVFFRALRQTQLLAAGTANGHPITARALVAQLAGHEAHHTGVLRERYGLS